MPRIAYNILVFRFHVIVTDHDFGTSRNRRETETSKSRTKGMKSLPLRGMHHFWMNGKRKGGARLKLYKNETRMLDGSFPFGR